MSHLFDYVFSSFLRIKEDARGGLIGHQGKRIRIMTHLRDFKFQISHHYHPTEVHCRLLTQGKVLICPYASWHSCKIRFRTRSLPRQSLLGSGLRDSPCALIGGALCHPALRAPLRGFRLRQGSAETSRGSGLLFVGEQGASPLPHAMPPVERDYW